jgi:hypothetical protein
VLPCLLCLFASLAVNGLLLRRLKQECLIFMIGHVLIRLPGMTAGPIVNARECTAY